MTGSAYWGGARTEESGVELAMSTSSAGSCSSALQWLIRSDGGNCLAAKAASVRAQAPFQEMLYNRDHPALRDEFLHLELF
jgi:hypothetical protein